MLDRNGFAGENGFNNSQIARSDVARIGRYPLPGFQHWHVNASKPLEDFLIQTKVTVDGIDPGAVRYPQPLQRTLGFNANAMAATKGASRSGS